ncbi:MAG: asparaginase domain-containing protein [Treponemataceae bacterium]|nr:asparaginase domain-containing protein [Treponemataceae bacterium]
MFQSHVYLEVRILISTQKKPFSNTNGLELDGGVFKRVYALLRSFNCSILETVCYERLTGNINVPSSVGFSGLSVKVGEKGVMPIEFHRRQKLIKIEEVRIEEDAGRLTHINNVSKMDYTWAGYASVRIKTDADFELGEEAELFLNELRRRLQYMQLVDNIPLENLIRCNAYVALARYPNKPDYYVKLRNLNSINFVRKAINAEIDRQESVLSSGGTVESESRLWNERQNLTESYKPRTVEEAGRRQFELLEKEKPFDMTFLLEEAEKEAPVNVDANLKAEQPAERCKRLCAAYGLAKVRAEFICDDKARADFFEQAAFFGADPIMTAHWLSSEFMKLLKRTNSSIAQSPVTPERFARIMVLLKNGQIHSSIAKQLLLHLHENGGEPDEILASNNWKQIIDKDVLLPLVQETINANPQEAEKLRKGEMAPLEFLTGLIMKKTDGLASPLVVKSLLKEELHINIVYVISMGGSICGHRTQDGAVIPADGRILKTMLQDIDSSIHYQVVQVGRMLSEEIEPADWAALIAEIASLIGTGTATGIVVAHGTDTLSYTAPLLYWLFSDAEVPVVVTASSETSDESSEAKQNLHFAVKTACKEKQGVFVAFGGKLLSPLNLKFERPSPDGFSNWNMKQPLYTCGAGPLSGLFNGFFDADEFVMRQVLREAANRMIVCRVYPGLRAESYVQLIDNGIDYIFLELYETGTGSMRNGDYSLKPLLTKGRKKGCTFFCTSQQQSLLDFSGYTTSRRMWREGAVPMGRLTTESAVALYFAASLVSDTREELNLCMEAYAELFE